MRHNRPIRLKVASRKDLFFPAVLLNLLLLTAALLGPNPLLMSLAAVVFGGAGWATYASGTPKTNRLQLISVIFADGRVHLESCQEKEFAGFLDGQQWCTRWFAVLRVANTNKRRSVLILSCQQRKTDELRRLNMWLRQGLFDCNRADRVLES